jgi:signal transduction histidine kinase
VAQWRPAERLTAPIQPVSPFAGLTIKAALVLGFGCTLGLWLFAGYRLTQRIADIESQTTAINSRYMRAQDLLSTVRAQVLLASVFVRDALLEPSPASGDSYQERFENIYHTADQALQQYVPVIDSPAERGQVAELRREVEDFHRAMLDVLATDNRKWPYDARALLQQRVVPKREVVMRVSDQVQALNRTAFVQQRVETSEIYRVAQRREWERLGVALAANLGVGLVASVYAGRLEARVRRQRGRDLEITNDLQRLSARLVSVQEDERRAIARELHDEVGQVLTVMKVELGLAQRASGSTVEMTARIEHVRTIAEGALQRIRDLSHLLHPSILDDLGLTAALNAQLVDVGQRHGIRIDLLHEHTDERLAPELETTIYRVVQEALTNVVKHAHASRCRVYLQGLANTVLVTIEDDGSGFPATGEGDAGQTRGLGLIGIRERITQLGGAFRLETAPGKGTRLTIELPARPWAGLGSDPEAALERIKDTTDVETANLPG